MRLHENIDSTTNNWFRLSTCLNFLSYSVLNICIYPSRRYARLRYEWFWAFSLRIDSKVFNLILEQKQWQQSNRALSCVRSLKNYETRMMHCKVLQSTNKEDFSTVLHTMLYNCFHTRQLMLTFTFIELAQWSVLIIIVYVLFLYKINQIRTN